MATHASTNWAQHRVTWLIETNVLPLNQTANQSSQISWLDLVDTFWWRAEWRIWTGTAGRRRSLGRRGQRKDMGILTPKGYAVSIPWNRAATRQYWTVIRIRRKNSENDLQSRRPRYKEFRPWSRSPVCCHLVRTDRTTPHRCAVRALESWCMETGPYKPTHAMLCSQPITNQGFIHRIWIFEIRPQLDRVG